MRLEDGVPVQRDVAAHPAEIGGTQAAINDFRRIVLDADDGAIADLDGGRIAARVDPDIHRQAG